MTSRTDLPDFVVNSKRKDVWSRVSPRAYERWNPEVCAKSEESEESGTISILDVIGKDFWNEGVTSKRIDAALRSIGDKPVTVSINSPGGDFFEGIAIYNILKRHSQPVTVDIVGVAASAASVIAMAGDEIRIARAGFLMLHNTWVVAMGNKSELRAVADYLEPFDATAVELYAIRSGIDEKEIAKILDEETWIRGSDAVEQGFADALLPSDEIGTRVDAASAKVVKAEIQLHEIMTQQGVPRGERRSLVRDVKGGTHNATATDTQNAVVIDGLRALLVEK